MLLALKKEQFKLLSPEECREILGATEKVLKSIAGGEAGLKALTTLSQDPKKWAKQSFSAGWFAETSAGKFSLNHEALSVLYSEAFDGSEKKELAVKGTAIRLALVLLHEGTHLESYNAEYKALGFGWPLSSLQDEQIAIRKEMAFYDRLMKDPEIRNTLLYTVPPRNYLVPAGSDSSMTAGFDTRLRHFSLCLEKQREEDFIQLVRGYYPGAIDLLDTPRGKLEV